MAGRIPPAFIDELLARTDIVDLISLRVPLKKAGKDFQACCPFHDEKTPSFTVSREKQFYHCFGCGAHGTAVGFLMEYDHMGFVETVEELARQAGLEVPREGGTEGPGQDYRPLHQTLEESAKFYSAQLRQHPDAGRAVNYLKQRGLSGEIAATFGLGYAPAGWDNLIQHLGNNRDKLELLRQTGLISEPDGKCYDRFRDRIMFPIRNHRGRTIGFGGRLLGDGKPKYLNSPETAVFHKGKELYGLYEARQALRKLERLLVVEGYMDVIALAQFGVLYSVATLGTAVTADHLERLFRTVPEIIFCFDGDRAGRDAGWKALETALLLMRSGREIRFLFLPEGEDPDTLIRKEGTEAFEQRIHTATPLSAFLFDKLAEQVDINSLDGRARLAELAKPLLTKVPKGVFSEMLYQRLGQLVGLSPTNLRSEKRSHNRPKPQRQNRPTGQTISPVRLAIALLLDRPQLGLEPDLPTGWQQLDTPGIPLLTELLAMTGTTPEITKGALLERWRDREEYRPLSKLAGMDISVPEEGQTAEFRDALRRLEEQYRDQETERLTSKPGPSAMTEEEKQRLKTLFSQRTHGKKPQPPMD